MPFSVDYACGDLDAWDGDSSSHGTHVSGIVAGNGGEGYDEVSGVKGAAYDAQIMFFKVFDENDDFGQESDEAVFAALDILLYYLIVQQGDFLVHYMHL